MKKLFIAFAAAFLMLFCMVSVHAEEYTITGTVTADDGIEIGEEGLEVTLEFGSVSVYFPAPSYRAPIPYTEYYEYDSSGYIYTLYPSYRNFRVGNTTTITIPHDKRSVDFSCTVSSSRYSYVRYSINDEIYIGNLLSTFDHYECVDIVINQYSKKANISGTISLPEAYDTDTKLDVAVHKNGSTYPRYATQTVTIPAGELSAQYSLDLSAYDDQILDYCIIAKFPGEQHKYISKEILLTPGKHTVDLTAERSKKISGTIALPENVKDFDTLDVEIKIQSAVAPYYFIDNTEVTLTQDTKSAYFELYDDLDMGDVILSYSASSSDGGIYKHGMYVDDTKCTPTIKKATPLIADNQTVVLNIIKANKIDVTFNKEAGQSIPMLDALVQTTSDFKQNISDTELPVRASVTNSDETSATYSFMLPEEYDNYILNFINNSAVYNDFDAERKDTFVSDNGSTHSISGARIFSVSEDGAQISVDYCESEHILPICISAETISGKNSMSFNISLYNTSENQCENTKIYLMLYDERGSLYDVISEDSGCVTRHNSTHAMSIPTDKYEATASIYAVCWDGMRPLSEKLEVK